MTVRKIPPDAFEAYVAMGPDRSYQNLANHYDVTKRAVTKLAARERWSERLARIDNEARDRSDAKLVENFEEMRTRHVRMLRVMAGKVLAALKQYPLSSGMEAMRAAESVIKLERLVAGEAIMGIIIAGYVVLVTDQALLKGWLTFEPRLVVDIVSLVALAGVIWLLIRKTLGRNE